MSLCSLLIEMFSSCSDAQVINGRLRILMQTDFSDLVLVVVGVLVVEHPGDGEPEVRAEEVDEDGVAGVDGAQLLPADDLVSHEKHDLDEGHHDQLRAQHFRLMSANLSPGGCVILTSRYRHELFATPRTGTGARSIPPVVQECECDWHWPIGIYNQ